MAKEIPIFEPFNPLDKKHLGESAAYALLESEIYDLPPEPFVAAGVYGKLKVHPTHQSQIKLNRLKLRFLSLIRSSCAITSLTTGNLPPRGY